MLALLLSDTSDASVTPLDIKEKKKKKGKKHRKGLDGPRLFYGIFRNPSREMTKFPNFFCKILIILYIWSTRSRILTLFNEYLTRGLIFNDIFGSTYYGGMLFVFTCGL